MKPKFKVGDIIKVINPKHSVSISGEVLNKIAFIDEIYGGTYPYLLKFISNMRDAKHFWDSVPFRDDELKKISKEEAMLELL